jgi:hypothetical protein
MKVKPFPRSRRLADFQRLATLRGLKELLAQPNRSREFTILYSKK